MLDRVPAPGKANRIRILQDDGTVIEGIMSYADDATQEGSPYTKGNVLSDDTCFLLGLESASAQPNDAFRILALRQGIILGRILVTLQTEAGEPVEGVPFVLAEQEVKTDANGQAWADVAPGSYNADFSLTIGYEYNVGTELDVTATAGQLTRYTVIATQIDRQELTISGVYIFSDGIAKYDVFACGGGASGAALAICEDKDYVDTMVAAGGAGGYTSEVTDLTVPADLKLTVAIGKGGSKQTAQISGTYISSGVHKSKNGLTGGSTTVTADGSQVISANGGGAGYTNYHNGISSNTISPSDGGSGGGPGQITAGTGESFTGAYAGNPGYNGSGAQVWNDEEKTYEEETSSGQGTTTMAFGSGRAYASGGGGCAGCTGAGTYTAYGHAHVGGGDGRIARNSRSGIGNQTVYDEGGDATTPGSGGGACIVTLYNVGSGDGYDITAVSGAGADGVVVLQLTRSE